MTETSTPRPPRRFRWGTFVAVVVGALLVVVAVCLVAAFRSNPDTPPAAAPPVAQTYGTEPPTNEATPGASGADGCLGGPDPHTAVLAAAQVAPLNDEGAAAYARALARWLLTYPIDPAMPDTLGQVLTNPADAGLIGQGQAQMVTSLAAGGITKAWVEGDGSQYRLMSHTRPAPTGPGVMAIVQVVVMRQATGAAGAVTEARMTVQLVLTAPGNHWTFTGSAPFTGDPYAAGIIPFTNYRSGC